MSRETMDWISTVYRRYRFTPIWEMIADEWSRMLNAIGY